MISAFSTLHSLLCPVRQSRSQAEVTCCFLGADRTGTPYSISLSDQLHIIFHLPFFGLFKVNDFITITVYLNGRFSENTDLPEMPDSRGFLVPLNKGVQGVLILPDWTSWGLFISKKERWLDPRVKPEDDKKEKRMTKRKKKSAK